jgi:peroxiredoxin
MSKASARTKSRPRSGMPARAPKRSAPNAPRAARATLASAASSRTTTRSASAAPRRRRTRRSARPYWVAGVVAAIGVILAASLSGKGPPAGLAGVQIATVPVGSVAPAFSGRDVLTGQWITTSTLEHRNVLYYFSSGSTCQACMLQAEDLQKNLLLFQKAHITLVMITNDTPAALTAAAGADGLTLPMVADPSGTMTARFGAVGGGMNMGANNADHSFILVDSSGVVRFHRDYPNMWVSASALMKEFPHVG